MTHEEKQFSHAWLPSADLPYEGLFRSLACFPFGFVFLLLSFKSFLGGASGKEPASQCQSHLV